MVLCTIFFKLIIPVYIFTCVYFSWLYFCCIYFNQNIFLSLFYKLRSIQLIVHIFQIPVNSGLLLCQITKDEELIPKKPNKNHPIDLNPQALLWRGFMSLGPKRPCPQGCHLSNMTSCGVLITMEKWSISPLAYRYV